MAIGKNCLEINYTTLNLKVSEDISKDSLIEAFCQFTEDDYYEWLKDSFKSFFEHGNPDWDWIRNRIKFYEKQ